MAAKIGGKTIFEKSRQLTLQIPCGSKISSKSLYLAPFLINMFLRLRQKLKMAAKSGGKTIFGKVASRLCRYSRSQKFCRNCSISLRFQDKHIFAFYTEIKDGRQKWWKNDFLGKLTEDSQDTPWVKNFVEIALSHSVSEMNSFLCLTQKFKMVAKKGGKMIFAKSLQ